MGAHTGKSSWNMHTSYPTRSARSAQSESERIPRICVPGSSLRKNEGVGVATSSPSTHYFFKAVLSGFKSGHFLKTNVCLSLTERLNCRDSRCYVAILNKYCQYRKNDSISPPRAISNANTQKTTRYQSAWKVRDMDFWEVRIFCGKSGQNRR